jgi:hypothetical protein
MQLSRLALFLVCCRAPVRSTYISITHLLLARPRLISADSGKYTDLLFPAVSAGTIISHIYGIHPRFHRWWWRRPRNHPNSPVFEDGAYEQSRGGGNEGRARTWLEGTKTGYFLLLDFGASLVGHQVLGLYSLDEVACVPRNQIESSKKWMHGA